MSINNDESHIGPQPDKRARRELDIPMASLQERLEAIHSSNGRGTSSREEETHSPARGDITNLLLLELLRKKNKQIRRQSKQLEKMMEARENSPMENNSYMFKLANLNPPMYDGAPNPKAFKDWIQGMEKLFNTIHAPRSGAWDLLGSILGRKPTFGGPL